MLIVRWRNGKVSCQTNLWYPGSRAHFCSLSLSPNGLKRRSLWEQYICSLDMLRCFAVMHWWEAGPQRSQLTEEGGLQPHQDSAAGRRRKREEGEEEEKSTFSTAWMDWNRGGFEGEKMWAESTGVGGGSTQNINKKIAQKMKTWECSMLPGKAGIVSKQGCGDFAW